MSGGGEYGERAIEREPTRRELADRLYFAIGIDQIGGRHVTRQGRTPGPARVRFGMPDLYDPIFKSRWTNVMGLEQTALIVIDLDVHDEFRCSDYNRIAYEWNRQHHAGTSWLRGTAPPRPSPSALRRFEYGRRCKKFVDELRDALPGVDVHVETSSRGIHVFLILDHARPVREAREVALDVLKKMNRRLGPQPEGHEVEVFPRVDTSGKGTLCRLPLTAGNRLLGDDLETPRYARRSRSHDILEVLAGRRWCAPDSPQGESTEPEAEDVVREPGEPRLAVVPTRVEPIRGDEPVKSIQGALDDDRVRDLLGVELQRGAFRDVISYCVEKGIPNDGAFAFVQKFSSLCLYAGLGEVRAMRAFNRLLEKDHHASTHCQTPKGRGKLSGKFRSAFRYQLKLAADGRIRRGALRDPVLLGLLAGLLGESAPAHMLVRTRRKKDRERPEAVRRQIAEIFGAFPAQAG